MSCTPNGASEAKIELDRVLSVLEDRVRRRLLVALIDEDSSGETAFQPEELLEDKRVDGRLRTELRHVHLPRLEEAKIIEWDRETNTITGGSKIESIQSIVELFEDNEEALSEE